MYTFKDTGEREITVNLNNGNNSVEITTNKPCQGVYNKSVTVKSITLYPIPVTNYLNISGVTGNSAIVAVRSLEELLCYQLSLMFIMEELDYQWIL